MTTQSNKATNRRSPLPPRLSEPTQGPDRVARDDILRAIDEWLSDESGYDEKVWPELKKAIEANRLSARKRFRD